MDVDAELKKSVDFIMWSGVQCKDSQERIEERIRFAELLWYHAKAGWVNPDVITRLLNFACNPQSWEEWKCLGGDTGVFLDDD